jgi:hypothetical protein
MHAIENHLLRRFMSADVSAVDADIFFTVDFNLTIKAKLDAHNFLMAYDHYPTTKTVLPMNPHLLIRHQLL